jgi:2,4-dienoyl-CoA reductase-like NADH-dependent reductase (Old Yellow Enzyme family)
MPPIQTFLATNEGTVTESLIDHYLQRFKSLGLLIVEHSYVSVDGKESYRQLGVYDDVLIPGLGKLARSLHPKSIPVVLQINHSGSIDCFSGDEEIKALIEAFAKATNRAMKADFDGIEIHGAHGHLLNQFFSPITNHRKDKYGGNLENRMKLSLEVVKRVKEEIDDRLLLYRIGSDDLDPKGTKIEDSQKFAVKLEEHGVDIIDVSGGICGDQPNQLRDIQGYFIPQAQKIKTMVNVPVIGVGGITEPEYANMLIMNEKVDMVAIGRELIRDPEWATDAIRALISK